MSKRQSLVVLGLEASWAPLGVPIMRMACVGSYFVSLAFGYSIYTTGVCLEHQMPAWLIVLFVSDMLIVTFRSSVHFSVGIKAVGSLVWPTRLCPLGLF